MSTKRVDSVSKPTRDKMRVNLLNQPAADDPEAKTERSSKRLKKTVVVKEEEEEVTEIPPTPQPVRAQNPEPTVPIDEDLDLVMSVFTKVVAHLAFPTAGMSVLFRPRRIRVYNFMKRVLCSIEECERLALEKDDDAIAVTGAMAGLNVLTEHEFFCAGDTYLTELRYEVFGNHEKATQNRTAMTHHFRDHQRKGVTQRCYLCRFVVYANRLNPASITGSVALT